MENEASYQDPVIPQSTIEKPSFAGIFDDEQELTGNEDWVALPNNGPDSAKIIMSSEVRFPPRNHISKNVRNRCKWKWEKLDCGCYL